MWHVAVEESPVARENATKVTWSEVSNHLTQSDNQPAASNKQQQQQQQHSTTWVFPVPWLHWRCRLCGSVYQRAVSSVLCKFKGIQLTPRLPLCHIRHSKHTTADRNYFVFFFFSVILLHFPPVFPFPFPFASYFWIFLHFITWNIFSILFYLILFFGFYVRVCVCVRVCKYTHLGRFCCSSAAENFAFCRKSK